MPDVVLVQAAFHGRAGSNVILVEFGRENNVYMWHKKEAPQVRCFMK